MIKTIRIDVKLEASDTSASTTCSPVPRAQRRPHDTVPGDRPPCCRCTSACAQQCPGRRSRIVNSGGTLPRAQHGHCRSRQSRLGTETAMAQQTSSGACGSRGPLLSLPPLWAREWDAVSSRAVSSGSRFPGKPPPGPAALGLAHGCRRPGLTWPQVCRDGLHGGAAGIWSLAPGTGLPQETPWIP